MLCYAVIYKVVGETGSNQVKYKYIDILFNKT